MNKLVIIGNGFDLGHNLPTQFKNFIESNEKYLQKYKIFKGENWNNIEENYKNLVIDIMKNREYVDVSEILESIISEFGFDKYGEIAYLHLESKEFLSEVNKVQELVELLTNFEKNFIKYLRKNCNQKFFKNITPRERIKDILKESRLIINFNYTDVVEKVYSIRDIIHIHGHINDNNIAIGTDALDELMESMMDTWYPTEIPCKDKYAFQEKMLYYEEDEDGNLYEKENLRRLFNEIESSIEENESKLFTLIDKKNKDALYSRNNVKRILDKERFDEVIILGHSLGEADMSVFSRINKTAYVTCYYYEGATKEDINRMKHNLDVLKLNYDLVPNGLLYK